jgi:hypothetical protein
MMLRNHPLLSYRGLHSWPPAWHSLGDGLDRHPKGEVGVLKEVKVPFISPFNRCFLIIEYKAALYMGCLLVDDIAFCTTLSKLLQRYCGEDIRHIASLDIGQML